MEALKSWFTQRDAQSTSNRTDVDIQMLLLGGSELSSFPPLTRAARIGRSAWESLERRH